MRNFQGIICKENVQTCISLTLRILFLFSWDAAMDFLKQWLYNINVHIQICKKKKVLGVDKLKNMYKKGRVHGQECCLFKY